MAQSGAGLGGSAGQEGSSGPGPDIPGPQSGDLCPQCGDQMRAHPTRRGLNYGLRPGREVLEQTCVGCGLLRVRVLPARGVEE